MDVDIAAYGDTRPDYDALHWARRHDEEEASAYLAKLAPGGRALELGVGSGRVALPLARRGLKVLGVEASASMAKQLTDKITDEAVETRIGDFAELTYSDDFDLIYCVSETFFLLATQERQLRCVEIAAEHLTDNGRLVVQVTVPDHDLFCQGQRTSTRHLAEDSVTVATSKHYRTQQRVEVQNVVIGKQGNEFFPNVYRYVWPSELDLMARLAGLTLVARYDGWRDEPYTATGGYVSVYAKSDRPGEALPKLPFQRSHVLDTPPELRALQTDPSPARVRTPTGDEAWLVTRYRDVRALLADPRLGRSHPEPGKATRLSNSAFNTAGPSGDYESEQEDHARYRQMLAPAFSARRMRALGGRSAEILDDLLGRMAGLTPPVDLHETLSLPFSLTMICELLGLPYEDRDRFQQWFDGLAGMNDLDRSTEARRELTEYMSELTDRKRRAPTEDLISDLANHRADRRHVDPDEIPYIAATLLFAGYRTTATKIDYGTVLLLANPAQRDALLADPSLVEGAVEEVLRLASPDTPLLRYAREDLEIAGTQVGTGEAVLLSTLAANRDESVFENADSFDIRRHADPHVSFGHGHRLCIGASLARVELQAVFGMLFTRFPSLRLAMPVERLNRRGDIVVGGLTKVPVEW